MTRGKGAGQGDDRHFSLSHLRVAVEAEMTRGNVTAKCVFTHRPSRVGGVIQLAITPPGGPLGRDDRGPGKVRKRSR